MIFATVGTQLPFRRMLHALDDWAGSNPGVPVLAQTGDGQCAFHHMETVEQLGQREFRQRFKAAKLIVAHAGMGTILSAAELGKPIVLMPRRAEFGEHRNDHQLDTAQEMMRLSNVTVANDAEALHETLDWYARYAFEVEMMPIQPDGAKLEPLLDVIRTFVWSGHEDQQKVASNTGARSL
ncbi:glycosyltransferase family 28 protein [Tropicibacter sp. R16_0]|uniref:glycosyltransferase n=1 Tax=Tropicibacter sp. R16_0 TaxID=2821102 RepID=UPI001ADCA7B8|nr:glycosyltransferase [Tropicibacter sp. R16_0]MBO9450817.1 glycosyltransferase family 28 protein [Tropicibacter sp. R16_0]